MSNNDLDEVLRGMIGALEFQRAADAFNAAKSPSQLARVFVVNNDTLPRLATPLGVAIVKRDIDTMVSSLQTMRQTAECLGAKFYKYRPSIIITLLSAKYWQNRLERNPSMALFYGPTGKPMLSTAGGLIKQLKP